ncbi:MAG TPA: GFA family protein [Pseudomonadales bacterium]|nr:GFA family protein [Pseudomonadales bacterium]
MIRGSCLCGAVTYEIDGDSGAMGHCHCHMCQKGHGAAFATYVNVRWDQFRLLSGAEDITRYASSEGTTRTFCRVCGSNLQFIRDNKPGFGIAAGSLDSDPQVRPTYQIWTSSKVPWWELQHRDGLVSHATTHGSPAG